MNATQNAESFSSSKNLKSNVTAAVGQVTERARDLAERGKHALNDRLESASHQLSRSAEEFRDTALTKAKDWESQTAAYIREKPLQTVGIAVGVGLVFGFLLRR